MINKSLVGKRCTHKDGSNEIVKLVSKEHVIVKLDNIIYPCAFTYKNFKRYLKLVD